MFSYWKTNNLGEGHVSNIVSNGGLFVNAALGLNSRGIEFEYRLCYRLHLFSLYVVFSSVFLRRTLL